MRALSKPYGGTQPYHCPPFPIRGILHPWEYPHARSTKMPKSRAIRDYPWQAYYSLFERVATTKEAMAVPCQEGRIKPMSLRGEVYAWRRACIRDEAEARAMGIDTSILDQVVVSIEDGLVRFTHKDNTGAASAVLEALAQVGVAKPKAHEADAISSLNETLRKLGMPAPGDDDASTR